MSITDKSAEADFFVAFSRQYKLSTPKTCICQNKRSLIILEIFLKVIAIATVFKVKSSLPENVYSSNQTGSTRLFYVYKP